MATAYDQPDFKVLTENDRQPVITNSLGRTIELFEFVLLSGYFGECVEPDGIANGATGRINVDHERIVQTDQINTAATFVAGNPLYYKAGSSSVAGTLESSSSNATAIGTITGFGGRAGAHTYVEFRPYLQKADNGDLDTRMTAAEAAIEAEQAEPKILVQKVTTGAASIAVTGLAEGDEIIDVMIIPTGASTNGTIKITDGTHDITNAMTCASDQTIARAGTINDAYSTLPAAGAAIVCAGDTVANTRAIIVITYIPVAA